MRHLNAPVRTWALRLILIPAVVSACGGGAATASPTASSGPTASSSPTAIPLPALRDLAEGRMMGSAVGLPQLGRDAVYAATLTREFNSVTAENAMKWGPVEPERGKFDWAGADEIVTFAEAHGQKVRGHTLVWHNQLPGWLTEGTFTPSALSEILRSHIATEAGRYAGRVYAWDVVNEPFNDDGTWRDTIWYRGLGQGYVGDAFRWARAADPNAKLYLNDYDVEGVNAKSDALYELAKSLKAQGVPIDGVGFQGHFDLAYDFPADMADNLKRFADLGLEVAITELDVRMTLPATTLSLERQADYYRQAVSACVSLSACVGITVWGFDDKYSWVPYSFPGLGAAGLLDDKMSPKPAYRAFQEALLGGTGETQAGE